MLNKKFLSKKRQTLKKMFTFFVAICTVIWTIGVPLGQILPVQAAINVANLNNVTTENQVLAAGSLVNLMSFELGTTGGTDTLDQVNLEITGANGFSPSDLADFVEGASFPFVISDAPAETFAPPGNIKMVPSTALAGSSPNYTVSFQPMGGPGSLAIPSTPTTYYLLASVNAAPTNGHQMTVVVPAATGIVVNSTNVNIGTPISTELLSFGALPSVDLNLFGYGPQNGMTEIPQMVPLDFIFDRPLATAVINNLSSYFSVSPSVTGDWEYINETWGANTYYRVTFFATDGLELSTEYTVSVLKTVTDSSGNALVVSLNEGLPALTTTDTAYSFSITTSATETSGGFLQPMAMAGSPYEGQQQVSPSLTSVTVNFDRPNMDATTFGGGNIYLAKIVNNLPVTVAGTSVVPATGTSNVATIKDFTLDASSQYRVYVTRNVADDTGQVLAGMPTGSGTMGPYYYDFYTSATGTAITSSFIGTNLNQYLSSGVIVDVPQGFIISATFDQPLDPSTVNSTNVTLVKDAANVGGTVEYDSQANMIRFVPTAILEQNGSYTFNISTSVTSSTGQAITAVEKAFTVIDTADITKPKLVYAEADNYGLMVQFDEVLANATAIDKSNYTLKTRSDSTDWSSVSATSLTSVNVRYKPEENVVLFDGLSLTSDNEFQLTVSTSVTDLAGNALDNASSINIKTGYVMDSSLFFGGDGMFTMDNTGIEDFDMSSMGIMPIGVMPMSNMVGATTKYFTNIPITTQVPVSGTIEFKFPVGFNVTNVIQDAQSPINSDFNGIGIGNTLTFAGTDPAGTTSNGVDNDGIGIIGDRIIVVKLSAATQANDFLSIDFSGIVNTNVPKGAETDGYKVEVKTKTADGVLLEALNSMPFFINGGGTNTINGEIHGVANGDNDSMKVYLGSPMTGPQEKTVVITGTGDSAADGSFSFSNLPNGEYYLFTNPDITLCSGSCTYFGQPMPETIYVTGGETKSKNITLTGETSGSVTDLTVTLIGDFRTGGVADQVDIFAGSPNGFRVKTVTPGNTAGTAYHLYLPAGEWNVGVGPAMSDGPMSSATPMPDWLAPKTTSYISTGSGTATMTINLGSQAVMNVVGNVVDENGSAIANAEVFAYSPNSNFGGAHTISANDGSFTLKVPVIGQYIVGAFKPGLPNAQDTGIEVKANTGASDGNASADIYLKGTLITGSNTLNLKINKPSYTISGKILNSAGNAVAFAPVWANQTNGYSHADTTTDASGNYILYVNAGTWQVEGNAPGIGWLQYSSTLTVTDASKTNINLQPNASTNYYTITGTVTINGQAQAYMPIRAVEYNASGVYQGREYSATTDSSGAYQISAPAGIYRVDIWTPDYGEIGRTDADDYANNQANVNLTSGNKSGVNIVVAADDLNTVTIVFNNKAAYSNVKAFINIEGYDVVNEKPTGYFKSKRIDDISATSASTTVKLEDGNYHFFVDVEGYGSYIPVEGNFDSLTTPGYIDVGDASADSNTATFNLPDISSAANAVTVTGTIYANGNALKDAWVWVANPDSGYQKGTSSATDGSYSLVVPVLATGTYMIGADKPGYMSPQPVALDITDANADGNIDTAKDITLSTLAYTISGSIYADANGGTSNQMDSGEAILSGWVFAEETTTGAMSHSQVDPNGSYTLGVNDGVWKVFGASDGYTESQYSIAGINSLITVTDSNLTGKNIKLAVNSNWTNKRKNKPITPSSGGIIDDTNTTGTGVKMTIPANALGSDSSAGSVSISNTSSVTKTNSSTPFGGIGKSITATDNAGQPITNLNDYVDIEMVYFKSDIDTQIADNQIVDLNKLKTMQVSYFDASLNDWVSLPTTRTAYYKVNADDPEWLTYSGNANYTGFQKFINDALVNQTFTGFEDYKLVFKTATNHFTVFGVTTPTDSTAPATPTGLVQLTGTGTAVSLDWDNNSDADLLEYEIYRSTTTGVNKTSTQANSTQITASTFADSGLTEWTSYFYTVTAVDDSSNESTIATELQVCSTMTVSNGTVAGDCAITCDSGYSQSGNSCVAQSSGGGGGMIIAPSQPVQTTEPEDTATETEDNTDTTENESTEPSSSVTETIKDGLNSLTEMTNDAITIVLNKLDEILSLIGKNRDLNLERERKTIAERIHNYENISTNVQNTIDNFVTYGTATTLKLGAGERAGVLNSYEAAFGKLPTTQNEWNDVIKIGNGRWPSGANAARETWANKVFKQIYDRDAIRTNAHDDAAIVIIAYGLRPVDRNLDSEKAAIKSFKWVYGYYPSDAEDWDTVRAIAYSGATR